MNGNLVKLRKLTLRDVNSFSNWVTDKEVVRYSLSKWQRSYTKEELTNWLKESLADKKIVNFGIVETSSAKLIGYAGISSIKKEHNSGEYFIFIGDKDKWGKGYGTEVTRLVVDYGFRKLKLHRISLTVSEPNVAALKVYLKVGFKKEGIMRDSTLTDGVYHSKIMMSILESEWGR